MEGKLTACLEAVVSKADQHLLPGVSCATAITVEVGADVADTQLGLRARHQAPCLGRPHPLCPIALTLLRLKGSAGQRVCQLRLCDIRLESAPCRRVLRAGQERLTYGVSLIPDSMTAPIKHWRGVS